MVDLQPSSDMDDLFNFGAPSNGKFDPILWVGDASPIRLPLFFPFQKNEVEIIYRASCSEALSLLKEQKFSSILVQCAGGTDALEFLFEAGTLQPMAPRLLIAENLIESEVREGINRAPVFRFMSWPLSEREV